MSRFLFALAILFALAGCRTEPTDAPAPPEASRAAASGAEIQSVSMLGGDGLPDSVQVERDRYTGRTRMEEDTKTEVDTLAQAEAARSNPERLTDLDTERTWSNDLRVPLGGDVAGPSVLKLQVLLDRASFSPGQIDGRWGDNTETALVWFQKSASMKGSGVADSATVQALGARAGRPQALVVEYTLTAKDVEGPFDPLPSDVYEKAKLKRLGYESLGEKLGEMFHAAPALLSRLNDGASLNSLKAGDTIRVPNVLGSPAPFGAIATIVVSGSGHYLHGVTSDGKVVYHAPATLGAEYDPSPSGDFTVTAIAPNPNWYYQPALLSGVDDDGEDAILPPGPNNAVGTVWIDLSEPHYGIHGTPAPGTIGYATSSGCTRLTNWDVERLSKKVSSGTPVQFRDITGRDASGAKTSGANSTGSNS